MAIFPSKKAIESQWKVISKRKEYEDKQKKTKDILVAFQVIDKGLETTKYDREEFQKRVLSSQNDVSRFLAGLKANLDKVKEIRSCIKDLTSKEKSFFDDLEIEINTEFGFWNVFTKSEDYKKLPK